MSSRNFARMLLAFLVGAFALSAAPDVKAEAKAAGPGAGEKKADAKHEEHDPTAFIDLPKKWDLTIYTLVVFVLLFAILYFFAWPNISKGLQKREEMLFKESEVNYIFKKEKPVIQLGDFITSVAPGASKEKRFRVRALLKGTACATQRRRSRFTSSWRRRRRSTCRR